MEMINGRTAEEIKKRLLCCSKERGCYVCPDVAAGDCSLKLCADALALIERLEAAVPRWNSVEERLPEGECIAIGWQDEMLIGYVYRSGTGYACESDGEYLMDVTHWMPLPEPPEEGA